MEPLFEVLAHLDALATPAAPLDTAVWMAALVLPLIADSLQDPRRTGARPLDTRDDDSSPARQSRDVHRLDDSGVPASAEDDEVSGEEADESPEETAGGLREVKLSRRVKRELQNAERKRKKLGGEQPVQPESFEIPQRVMSVRCHGT